MSAADPTPFYWKPLPFNSRVHDQSPRITYTRPGKGSGTLYFNAAAAELLDYEEGIRVAIYAADRGASNCPALGLAIGRDIAGAIMCRKGGASVTVRYSGLHLLADYRRIVFRPERPSSASRHLPDGGSVNLILVPITSEKAQKGGNQ